MRDQLLDALDHRDDLKAVDADFVHLFSSWFNRGFLVLRRIDWSTPAMILEKIIRYEAVHASGAGTTCAAASIRRTGAATRSSIRRCCDEPLIFVEVALIARNPRRDRADPVGAARRRSSRTSVTTATFYSISNCQRGLAGVSFGNFLIKQVVAGDFAARIRGCKTFVTLSPAPDFAGWLDRERKAESSPALSPEDRAALAG